MLVHHIARDALRGWEREAVQGEDQGLLRQLEEAVHVVQEVADVGQVLC